MTKLRIFLLAMLLTGLLAACGEGAATQGVPAAPTANTAAAPTTAPAAEATTDTAAPPSATAPATGGAVDTSKLSPELRVFAWGEYIRHDPAMPTRIAASLDALWNAGKLNPLVGGVYPLERAAEALREIEDRRAIGKIVLAPRQ